LVPSGFVGETGLLLELESPPHPAAKRAKATIATNVHRLAAMESLYIMLQCRLRCAPLSVHKRTGNPVKIKFADRFLSLTK